MTQPNSQSLLNQSTQYTLEHFHGLIHSWHKQHYIGLSRFRSVFILLGHGVTILKDANSLPSATAQEGRSIVMSRHRAGFVLDVWTCIS